MFVKDSSSYGARTPMSPPADGSSPISTLPTELVSEILKHTKIQEIGVASLVCKAWHQASKSEPLWEEMCRKNGNETCIGKESWKDVCKREYSLFGKGKILDYEAHEIELSLVEQAEVCQQLKTVFTPSDQSKSLAETEGVSTFSYLQQKAQIIQRLEITSPSDVLMIMPSYIVRVTDVNGGVKFESSCDIHDYPPLAVGVKGNVLTKVSQPFHAWQLELYHISDSKSITFAFDSCERSALKAVQASSPCDIKLEWIGTNLYLSMQRDKASLFKAFQFSPKRQ